jgi:hypothetical protein
MRPMTSLRQQNFRLEEEILEALAHIKERDGIPVTEQVRRALKVWIAEKGVATKARRKRAATRTRASKRAGRR